MGEHDGLMLADSIPVYIVTHTFGCEMVALSGFTPFMSVVTLYLDTAGQDIDGSITGQTWIESLILPVNSIYEQKGHSPREWPFYFEGLILLKVKNPCDHECLPFPHGPLLYNPQQ